MSHTPAPWAFIADRRDAFGSIRHMGGEGHSLATIEWTDSGSTATNAVLISAAPELLAALEQCLPLVDAYRRDSGGDGDLSAMTARAAIKKARGKSC